MPVLSKTMAVRFRATSSVETSLMSTPSRAAQDRAATIAVGTARMIAQGQASTSMVTAFSMAVPCL